MDSFRRGYAFLKQAWQMAFADPDLILPSIYALIAGFVVTAIGSLPVILVFMLLGERGFGQVIGFVLGAGLIFAQYVVAYVFSAMTIYLIYGYLAEGDGRQDKAWAIVRRDFVDILSLAAASTVVNLLKSLVRGKGRRRRSNLLAGLIDTLWTEATYLVLPAMVVEDLNLKGGLQRATHIVRDNLLLVGVSTVGVKFVTGLLGFALGATGVGLGFGVGLGLVTLTNGNTAGVVSGIGLGVLIAVLFIMTAVVIGSYITTAYHTCLYLWAREIELADASGQSGKAVAPPAPLAAVLR